MNEISKNDALARLKNLCSRKELCSSEIKEKLRDWNVNKSDFDFILKTLADDNYISDLRFAVAFANDKVKFNKWGLNKIKYHLKYKGINQDFVNQAINNIDFNVYSGMVKNEIQKKIKSLKSPDLKLVKFKILNFAQQRGYETNLTMSILKEIIDAERE